MKWIEALKIYNQGQTKWCIPRRGTKEYEEVQRIRSQGQEKPKEKPQEKPEEKKEEKKEEAVDDWKAGIRDFIGKMVNQDGKLAIDYDSNHFITNFCILHLLSKYNTECAVFIGKGITKTSAYYTFDTGFYQRYISQGNNRLLMYQIGKRIYDCVHKGAKVVVIPFGAENHANMMIYRPELNSFEHFEPHGSEMFPTFPEDTKERSVIQGRKGMRKTIQTFRSFIPQWEKAGLIPEGAIYIPSSDICPVSLKRGFQAIEGDQRRQLQLGVKDVGGGFCQMWSLFYLEMVLKYPTIQGTELTQYAFEHLKNMGVDGFIRHIVNYSKELNNIIKNTLTGGIDIINIKNKGGELVSNIVKLFNDLAYRYIKSHGQHPVESVNRMLDELDAEKTKLEKEQILIENRIKTKAKGHIRTSKKRLEEILLRLDDISDFRKVLVNDRVLYELGPVQVQVVRGGAPPYSPFAKQLLKIFATEPLARSHLNAIRDLQQEIVADPSNQELHKELDELLQSYDKWVKEYRKAYSRLRDIYE